MRSGQHRLTLAAALAFAGPVAVAAAPGETGGVHRGRRRRTVTPRRSMARHDRPGRRRHRPGAPPAARRRGPARQPRPADAAVSTLHPGHARSVRRHRQSRRPAHHLRCRPAGGLAARRGRPVRVPCRRARWHDGAATALRVRVDATRRPGSRGDDVGDPRRRMGRGRAVSSGALCERYSRQAEIEAALRLATGQRAARRSRRGGRARS